MKIIVLGAGLVGGPMAADLARDETFQVTAADVNPGSLARLAERAPSVATLERNLSDPSAVTALVEEFDLVLNAVPGFMGFATLKAILEAGKPVVDIAFFAEDPFELDELARARGVSAIVDCGLAPGMSNLLAAHADDLLERTDSMLCYVGGLPVVREWPYEYKAVFSPIDVIAEYTRPARYVENGEMVVRQALSDPELIDFPGVGTLEAFNTDGLRTLATTLDIPNMKEKTLRYPGHIEKITVLRDTGFFGTDEIEIDGKLIRPIDVTARLLFSKWQFDEDEADVTVMQVITEGERGGRRVRHVFDLLDRYCADTGVHSMARTTGYTATVAVRLLAAGLYDRPGIAPPEFLGRKQECVDFMLAGLADRGVVFRETLDEIDA